MKKQISKKNSIVLIVSLLHGVVVFANDGDLDTTFNGTGKVTTDFFTIPFGDPKATGTSVLIQPDNQILVGGFGQVPGVVNPTAEIALARYNPNGSLDTSINDGANIPGTTTFFFGADSPGPHPGGFFDKTTVHLQSTNKIVVALTVLAPTEQTNIFGVARFNSADASSDFTFGSGNSFVIGPFGYDGSTANISNCFGMAIQADDKIICVGDLNASGAPFSPIALLERFTADGVLDTATFNPTGSGPDEPGTRSLALGTFQCAANAVIIQPADQKIVITGYSDDSFFVARYTTSGDLDTTFNAAGSTPGTNSVNIVPGITSDVGNAVTLQPNGQIVVAGSSTVGGGISAVSQFFVARFNADGTLDSSFGTGGVVLTPFGIKDDEAESVVIQTDGKIIAGGFALLGEYEFALARYTTQGILDITFGIGGKVTTPFSPAKGFSLALQPDAKIVLSGFATVSGTNNFATARYTNTNPTPTPPTPTTSCIDNIDALTQAIRNKYGS